MKYIKNYEAINIGTPKSGDYVVVIPKSFKFKPETIDFISHLVGILSIGHTTHGVNYYFSVREYNSIPNIVYEDIKIYTDYGNYQKLPTLFLPFLDSSEAKQDIVLWSNNKKDLQKNLDLYLSSLKFNI